MWYMKKDLIVDLYVSAAARRKGVSPQCIRNWIRGGLLEERRDVRDSRLLIVAVAALDKLKPPKRGRPKKNA